MPIINNTLPKIKDTLASTSVYGADVLDGLRSACGKNAIRLFKKCTVIGIRIFLYLTYKVQQAIPNKNAPNMASSI